jgi:hypothetical protein
MRLLLSCLAAAGAIVLASPAIAGAGNNTAPAASDEPAAAAPAKKEKLICVREREIGSNLSTKVCQTEAQWRAERKGTADRRTQAGD